MGLLDAVARRLSSNGYWVLVASGEVRFEDASVLGCVSEFGSVNELLEGWKHAEDTFVRRYSAALRRDLRKAWNVYTILLTAERASVPQRRDLVAIEENFQATRKVARAGIATEGDIEIALGVLLPIRHRVSMSSENALEAVSNRLSALPSEAVKALLAGGSGEHFANILVRTEESE